jgi:serine/threonine protein kinase
LVRFAAFPPSIPPFCSSQLAGSSAQDALGSFVAIKKITNLNKHPTILKRTVRELFLLRCLRNENVLSVRDVLLPRALDAVTDMLVVTDLMDTDLHQVISSPQRLSNEHIQYFIYQALRGLRYIHSAGLVHRDLKPSNLLVNANCDLKIADFGMARSELVASADDNQRFMTEYVSTRWYRAPEIMLSWAEYTRAIDVWALGCILAELLGRRPLFPGRDYVHQLKLIVSVIGTPSDEDVSFVVNDRAKKFLRALSRVPKVPFRTLFPDADPNALDLLDRMLVLNPHKRITVDEALKHPYVAHLHDPTDEPTAGFLCPDLDFDPKTHTQDVLKRAP